MNALSGMENSPAGRRQSKSPVREGRENSLSPLRADGAKQSPWKRLSSVELKTQSMSPMATAQQQGWGVAGLAVGMGMETSGTVSAFDAAAVGAVTEINDAAAAATNTAALGQPAKTALKIEGSSRGESLASPIGEEATCASPAPASSDAATETLKPASLGPATPERMAQASSASATVPEAPASSPAVATPAAVAAPAVVVPTVTVPVLQVPAGPVAPVIPVVPKAEVYAAPEAIPGAPVEETEMAAKVVEPMLAAKRGGEVGVQREEMEEAAMEAGGAATAVVDAAMVVAEAAAVASEKAAVEAASKQKEEEEENKAAAAAAAALRVAAAATQKENEEVVAAAAASALKQKEEAAAAAVAAAAKTKREQEAAAVAMAAAEPPSAPQNRAERKSRQAVEKLGLRTVKGVFRMTMKTSNGVVFVVKRPDVFKHPQQV